MAREWQIHFMLLIPGKFAWSLDDTELCSPCIVLQPSKPKPIRFFKINFFRAKRGHDGIIKMVSCRFLKGNLRAIFSEHSTKIPEATNNPATAFVEISNTNANILIATNVSGLISY